MLRQIKQSIY